MPYSPEQILEIASKLPTNIAAKRALENKTALASKGRQISLPASIANIIILADTPILAKLWAAEVGSYFSIDQKIFSGQFMLTAGRILAAESTIAGRDISEPGWNDTPPVVQAIIHHYDDLAKKLLIEDQTGFKLVDHFAYSELAVYMFRNTLPEETEMGLKIISSGAERYKRLYSAATEETYTPRT